MIKKIVLIVFFVIFMMVNAQSYNLVNFDEQRDHFRLGMYMADLDLFDGYFILTFKDKINLTPKQEKEIEHIILSYKEFYLLNSAQIKVQELRLASYIKSDKVNRKKIEETIKELSRKKTDFMITYVNSILDLKKVLTPKQIEDLKKARDSIKHKYMKKHPSNKR